MDSVTILEDLYHRSSVRNSDLYGMPFPTYHTYVDLYRTINIGHSMIFFKVCKKQSMWISHWFLWIFRRYFKRSIKDFKNFIENIKKDTQFGFFKNICRYSIQRTWIFLGCFGRFLQGSIKQYKRGFFNDFLRSLKDNQYGFFQNILDDLKGQSMRICQPSFEGLLKTINEDF